MQWRPRVKAKRVLQFLDETPSQWPKLCQKVYVDEISLQKWSRWSSCRFPWRGESPNFTCRKIEWTLKYFLFTVIPSCLYTRGNGKLGVGHKPKRSIWQLFQSSAGNGGFPVNTEHLNQEVDTKQRTRDFQWASARMKMREWCRVWYRNALLWALPDARLSFAYHALTNQPTPSIR